MKKKITSLFLASLTLLAVGLGACGEKKEGEIEDSMVVVTDSVNTTELDYKPEDTNAVLAKDGTTEYKIVVASGAANDVDLTFASTELKYFFEQATGASISIETDEGKSFSDNGKYIVLGKNAISQASGMSMTYEEFGEDGSHIKTFGNTVLINSAYSAGAKYGVYEFLFYNLGIRIYGYDEFKIPDHTTGTVMLKNFDYKWIPDFAERTNGINERYDETTAYRLGWNKGFGENWYAWCHTYFQLLPKAVYFDEHRDWYSADGNQLCLSNQEMILELTNVMKNMIETSTYRLGQPGFFQLGHEDANTFCNCERCVTLIGENGGEESAVMMMFMNDVARIMNPWLEENYPDAIIKWVTFAYGPTIDAPVIKKDDGTFEPVNDKVKAEKNVGVMLAPLSQDWFHNMTDKKYNERFHDMIYGWKAMEMETYVYSYCVNYDDWFLYMDNWSTVKDQYKTWVELDAQYMFEQGGQRNTSFYELTNYVHGRMLWDTDSDVEYYIADFMENYYKAGAPYVYEFLNRIRTRYKMLEREAIAKGEPFRLLSFIRSAPEMRSEEWWPMDWLLSAIDLLDKAVEECEKTMPAGEARDKAIKRIKAEQLSPIALLMNLYKFQLSNSDLEYYINVFSEGVEMNGITASSYYDLNIQMMIAEWRACLSE